MFTSALASVGGGGENRLRLSRVSHSVVILVDGLGFENLRAASAYGRFLNQNCQRSIRCEFPSTTASSIAGFATGLRSNQHGLVGYSVYDRSNQTTINLLTGWESDAHARRFKKVSTLAEASTAVPVFSIAPKVYENSGFTALTMSGAKYVGADSIPERFEAAEKLIRNSVASLSYLYVPELDQIAHRHGVESNQWLHALEELDLVVNRFISKLGNDVGVIVTADHGVVDVPIEKHIYLDEFAFIQANVEAVAGDPRCNFIYANSGADLSLLRTELQNEFGHLAYVCTPQELMECGWLGRFDESDRKYLPDFYVIWKESRVAYDRRFAKASHLRMLGQHGGISDEETRIPLIKLGKY